MRARCQLGTDGCRKSPESRQHVVRTVRFVKQFKGRLTTASRPMPCTNHSAISDDCRTRLSNCVEQRAVVLGIDVPIAGLEVGLQQGVLVAEEDRIASRSALMETLKQLERGCGAMQRRIGP